MSSVAGQNVAYHRQGIQLGDNLQDNNNSDVIIPTEVRKQQNCKENT